MSNTSLIETPGQVVAELARVRAEAERGLVLLQEAEEAYVRYELAADKIEANAFLTAQGTVADRTAVSKLQAAEVREAAELAKVKVNYIKTKLRHLSEATMSIQTSARMVELQWRTS